MNLKMIDCSKWKLYKNQLRMHLQLRVYVEPRSPKLERIWFNRKHSKQHEFLCSTAIKLQYSSADSSNKKEDDVHCTQRYF